MIIKDPRQAQVFRFVRHEYAGGEAQLVYAFDDGPELVERIIFPQAPPLPLSRVIAFDAALSLLHLIAGVSYYKAGIPADIRLENYTADAEIASFLEALYVHGLAEFAYQNHLNLRSRIHFPSADVNQEIALTLGLPRRTLVPIGGGKDSLLSVELLKAQNDTATAAWVGNSELIAGCARRSGLPILNIRRELAPLLFEYNRQGAYNGHIPVTAINSAILVVAAILYGYDVIAFSNERSASSATLEHNGVSVNHQWSKSWAFEKQFHQIVKKYVATDLHYCSLLRPLSELAVTQRFAHIGNYDEVFSSCNRNFRILGPKPTDRWCGQCPKCHFVFLALAPFMPKTRLLKIFGRNLLDELVLAPAFDALMEYKDHKPFECVGEAQESRAAMYALSQKPEWSEDAVVKRFAEELLPQLDSVSLGMERLLSPSGEHLIPRCLQGVFDAF